MARRPLEDAAALLLLLAARPVFVFALGHLLLAHLTHEVEEDLQADTSPPTPETPRRDQQSEVRSMEE